MAVADRRWQAMGTAAHVVVVGSATAELLDAAQRRVADLEQRWSRFDPASELSRLNARGGEVTTVSEETRLLIERALEGWRLSGGAFDPTVLGDVVRAGYDRSFCEIRSREDEPLSPYRPGCGEVRLDGDEVTLPAGVGLDSGGIGKGLAADLVALELMDEGAAGACVNLGGDLRVVGSSPGGSGWTVELEHPWAPRGRLALVGIGSGAVATSTTLRRRFVVAGRLRHHLIDPRSSRPADSGVNHVSVVSGDAWLGEVLAKAVLVNGGDHLFDILGGTGSDAVAVGDDGLVRASGGFSRYLGPAGLPERLLPVPVLSGG